MSYVSILGSGSFSYVAGTRTEYTSIVDSTLRAASFDSDAYSDHNHGTIAWGNPTKWAREPTVASIAYKSYLGYYLKVFGRHEVTGFSELGIG